MQSAKELYKYIISKIENIYNQQESSTLTFILMEHYGVSKQNYVLNDVCKIEKEVIDNKIEQLQKEIPIQYILGEAWFYDRKFKVDNNVLIPRQETEELCSLIIENHKSNSKNLKIIDLGTGSGCIPITLKLEIPDSIIYALDISEGALNIAKQNAENLNAEINFIQKDILNDEIDLSDFDIVISNPPYVLNSEKELMKSNVLDFEPHLALFVEDNKPLIFYEKIINISARDKVKHVYFEINESYGAEVENLMVTNGFQNVCIHRDLQNKNRIVFC